MTVLDQDAPARVRPAREAALVLGVFLVLGLLCGVLWAQVVNPADFTKVAAGGAMGENDLGKQFGADGWFVVIALAASLLAGLALSARRSRDPVLTVVLLVLGALLAAAVMSTVGHLLGPSDPGVALRAAKVGAKVPESLDVGVRPVWPLTAYLKDTLPVYAAWPIGALLGTLSVLLGRGQRAAPAGSDQGIAESAS